MNKTSFLLGWFAQVLMWLVILLGVLLATALQPTIDNFRYIEF